MSSIKVERLSRDELERRGVFSWPIWTKEVSRFDWFYDETEQCYFLEGEVVVDAAGSPVEIGAGDFVTFPRGLACVWDVRKPVRKHYRFDSED